MSNYPTMMRKCIVELYDHGHTIKQIADLFGVRRTRLKRAGHLTTLAVKVAAKARQSAMVVAKSHLLGDTDFWAMTTVISAHVLATRSPGSGVERLLLSVLAPH